MTYPVITAVFLSASVLTVILGAVGMAAMRGAAARLHFLSAVSLVAPPLMTAAVLCESGLSQAGVKTILIALVLLVQGPVVAHVLGRAIYAHERLTQAEREERQ
jgi:monovalent cation/proton antiporter MnhG/PhaG subunit